MDSMAYEAIMLRLKDLKREFWNKKGEIISKKGLVELKAFCCIVLATADCSEEEFEAVLTDSGFDVEFVKTLIDEFTVRSWKKKFDTLHSNVSRKLNI